MATTSILTPVTVLGGCVLAKRPTNCNPFSLTVPQRTALTKIESQYTIHLEDKQYQNVPTDTVQYLQLYNAVLQTQASFAGNSDVSLLLKITKEALEGAMNVYGLNVQNINLHIQNNYLEEIIRELLKESNRVPAFGNNPGAMTILQGFDLANLFKYYIQMYGLPSPGAGFDTNKLYVVYQALEAAGIDTGVASFSNIPISTACVNDVIVVNLYSKLAVFITSVNNMITEYSQGNVSAVASLLTQAVYDQLSAQISSLAYSSPDVSGAFSQQYTDYETIRRGTANSLAGLFQAIMQNSTLLETELRLESANELAGILLDPVKLKKYIEEYNAQARMRKIFPDVEITVKKATLKPQYEEYVRLYGFPPGAVFDPDKLGPIMKKLGLA